MVFSIITLGINTNDKGFFIRLNHSDDLLIIMFKLSVKYYFFLEFIVSLR